MSINYTTFISQLSNTLVISPTSSEFQIMTPGCIDYVENRIYRDLDLLTTRITNHSIFVSTNSRTVALSTVNGTYLSLQEVNIISPSSLTSTSPSAIRNPLTPVSQAWLTITYPSVTTASSLPQYYHDLDGANLLLGPAPDLPYNLEVTGTIFPSPLSSSNSSTWLTQNLPDLYMAAAYVFGFGYMRDFGGQADDPRSAQSWENQYQTLKQSANVLELRKKAMSQGWSVEAPNPVANPPRP